MIIATEEDVTPKVVSEFRRAESLRFREIMESLVKHLHAFLREVRLTEEEFQLACRAVNAIGKATTETHNEAVLMAGSLGVSQLVCLMNNAKGGETTANMLGPFWRQGAPIMPDGSSILRSPTPGDPLFADIEVVDADGRAVEGAEVDIWQSSIEGFYENQDPGQADMNLRGRFKTDARGRFRFRSILPAGYPIPISGPVGEMLRALGRHNMRPAHVHFMIVKPGYKTHVSQIYVPNDPYIETDVQFGVTKRLIGDYQRHEGGAPADDVKGPWWSLKYRFVIDRGDSKLPRPPITGKAGGERPVRAVLPTSS